MRTAQFESRTHKRPDLTNAPRGECLRIDRFVIGTCGVATARSARLCRVDRKGQALAMNVVPECLHAIGKTDEVSTKLPSRGVTRRRLLLPAVIHVDGRVTGSGKSACDHRISLSFIKSLADAVRRRGVRAIIGGGLQIAAKNLPAHPAHLQEQGTDKLSNLESKQIPFQALLTGGVRARLLRPSTTARAAERAKAAFMVTGLDAEQFEFEEFLEWLKLTS
jgi:hypothetical protein